MNTRTDRDSLPGSIRITSHALARDGQGLGKQGRSIIEKVTSPQSSAVTIGLKVCYGAEIASWTVAGISAFAFAIIVITPLLVPLLSFGSVFSEGWSEWLDFTVTAWKMSINPALIGITAVALAMGLRKGKLVMKKRLLTESEKGFELRHLEGLIKHS